ncbi:hypothetical protein ACOSQ2_001650 [Xanthoceras sorbifolium]
MDVCAVTIPLGVLNFLEAGSSGCFINLADHSKVLGLGPNNIIFVWVLWFIRKWRCARIFDENFGLPTNVKQPPENEWVKVNVDGSMRGDSRDIAAGGLIRDGHRNPGSIFLGLNLSWNQDYKQDK